MSAVCTRCREEGAEHPFVVPGPPFSFIEAALMKEHYRSDHHERIRPTYDDLGAPQTWDLEEPL